MLINRRLAGSRRGFSYPLQNHWGASQASVDADCRKHAYLAVKNPNKPMEAAENLVTTQTQVLCLFKVNCNFLLYSVTT